MDLNKIMTEMLGESKKIRDDREKAAYIDGALDYHNKMKKLEVANENNSL